MAVMNYLETVAILNYHRVVPNLVEGKIIIAKRDKASDIVIVKLTVDKNNVCPGNPLSLRI